MLTENHICKVQAQNFAILQRQYLSEVIPGDNISVLLPLNQMFCRNNNLTYAYACEAYKLFFTKGWCASNDFQTCYEQLATYGVALSSLFFGYNVSTNHFDLYTSSITILKQLATSGLLASKKLPLATCLQELEGRAYGKDKIKSTIGYNKIFAFRLDAELVGTKVALYPIVPRSCLDMSSTIIVPYTAYNETVLLLSTLAQERVLRVRQGDKVRVVTRNNQLLTSVYGTNRANYLNSQIPDARLKRFYLPSLGASINTAGFTNIHLEQVDAVEFVGSLAEVDLSEIKLDYSRAKEFFIETITKLPPAELKEVADSFGIAIVGNPKFDLDSFQEMVNRGNEIHLYEYMKAHPQYFDIKRYLSLPPKYGVGSKEIEKPKSVADLKALLRCGIYKILLNTRSGKFTTVICSNDNKCLEKIYGKNFYRFYESEGSRLREMERAIRELYPERIRAKDFYELIAKYNLKYLAPSFEIDTENLEAVIDSSKLYSKFKVQYKDIDERSTVVKQPNLVIARSCNAYLDESSDMNPVGYYKHIDLNSIVSIIQLSSGSQNV